MGLLKCALTLLATAPVWAATFYTVGRTETTTVQGTHLISIDTVSGVGIDLGGQHKNLIGVTGRRQVHGGDMLPVTGAVPEPGSWLTMAGGGRNPLCLRDRPR